jgi:hypothetical protein
MSKLSPIRTAVQILSIIAFGIVTIEAKPWTMSDVTRPTTEGSCCAKMAHGPPACPLTPGMNGSACCNLQTCLQLFLQTGELRLEPGYTHFRWTDFDSRQFTRSDRPPVPPPRA